MRWQGKPSHRAHSRFYLLCVLLGWLVVPLLWAYLRYRNTGAIRYYIDENGVGIWHAHDAKKNRFLEHERIRCVSVNEPSGFKEIIFHPRHPHLPPIVFRNVIIPQEVIESYQQQLEAVQSKSRIKSISIPVLQ